MCWAAHCGGHYMAKWTYFLLDAGALGSALAIAWRWRWWRAWLPAAGAITVVGAVFVAWDIAAAHAGHWAFNDAFTLGWRAFNLPLEEYLFFAAVGLVSLAVWGLQTRGPLRAISRWWLAVPILAACGLAGVYPSRGYSATVAAATLITTALLAWQSHLLSRRWLRWQTAMFGLFITFNTCLTALPIVTYGAGNFSGIRLGTIPLEDFLYSFTFTNCVLVAYAWLSKKHVTLPHKIDK